MPQHAVRHQWCRESATPRVWPSAPSLKEQWIIRNDGKLKEPPPKWMQIILLPAISHLANAGPHTWNANICQHRLPTGPQSIANGCFANDRQQAPTGACFFSYLALSAANDEHLLPCSKSNCQQLLLINEISKFNINNRCLQPSTKILKTSSINTRSLK